MISILKKEVKEIIYQHLKYQNRPFFSPLQILQPKRVWKFACSLQTDWARLFPNMARWLCNQAHGHKQRQTKWFYLRPFIPQAIPGTLLININVKQHSNRSGRISHQDINTRIKGKQKYEHHRKYFAILSRTIGWDLRYFTSVYSLTQDNICYAFAWWE